MYPIFSEPFTLLAAIAAVNVLAPANVCAAVVTAPGVVELAGARLSVCPVKLSPVLLDGPTAAMVKSPLFVPVTEPAMFCALRLLSCGWITVVKGIYYWV